MADLQGHLHERSGLEGSSQPYDQLRLFEHVVVVTGLGLSPGAPRRAPDDGLGRVEEPRSGFPLA